jgi:predicted RNA-binding Zn-ribbon protein involved in translation (DUF1610 family)
MTEQQPEQPKTDLLCADCGEALSTFLQEIADHNAKVTACPKCGKHHEFKRSEFKQSKTAMPTGRKRASTKAVFTKTN